jgi:hypothetical protein
LAVTLFSACVPDPVTTPTSSFLPDLVVSNVFLGMQGVPTDWTECIPNYGPIEIRAMIRNLGQTPAYNISLIELSTRTNLTIRELDAGQGMKLYFPISSANAAYNVVVDSQNTIPESNESNNTLSYIAITPTPPALCTSSPTSLLNPSTTLSAAYETSINTLSTSASSLPDLVVSKYILACRAFQQIRRNAFQIMVLLRSGP